MSNTRPLPAKASRERTTWCILYPDGRVMNADRAWTKYHLMTPGLYASRKDALDAIAQRILPLGTRPARIISAASWKVIK
jgi:hypothetical protein